MAIFGVIRKINYSPRTNLPIDMIRSFLIVAIRNLLRKKIYSFIHILGLTVGTAAFLLIIHYVRFERSYEDFHLNAPDIYRVTLDLYANSEYLVTDCEMYQSVGPILKAEQPEVLEFVRLFNNGNQQVRHGEKRFFEENLYFADSTMFDVFTLDFIQGNPKTALDEPYEAVINESTATKYFGRTDVLGEIIDIGNDLYKISGVFKDLPYNTHLKYDFLLSHVTISQNWEWYVKSGWSGNNEYLYLLMEPHTDLDAFNKKLETMAIALKDKIGDKRFHAEPMKDIHLYSHKTFEPEANGSARAVNFLLITAIFILVIAWVNYVNVSTARAVERAREVGIRKVMGSGRRQLVFQFLSEAAIVNVLSGILTLALVVLFLPAFRGLTGQPLSLDIGHDPLYLTLSLCLVLGGTLLSGVYPAFVLSSFQPASVLKGKFRSSGHGQWLRQGLVVFQFATTMVLMVGMSTVYLQLRHLQNLDLNMSLDHMLVLRGPQDTTSYEARNARFHSLKTALLLQPAIKGVTRSESLPGLSLHEISTSTGIRRVGEDTKANNFNYYIYGFDADFIPTFDMDLVAGRNFKPDGPNDDQTIINETAVTRLGFSSAEDAIGQKISFQTRWPGEPSTVIGVLKDFSQRAPKEEPLPMIFSYNDWGQYYVLHLGTADIKSVVTSVKTVWDQVIPNDAFDYFFLDERYNQQYRGDVQFEKVITLFASLAALIACLGLFGLASYTMLQRTKEVGIRKVLGASVVQIVQLLTRDFVRLVAIAVVIGLPLSYYLMDNWLSTYASRVDLNGWIFLWPVLLLFLIAVFTVSIQTLRAAVVSPTESLKQE